jgi:succinate dehydrogenase / fumarate reductase cytochrome b subunit
MPVATFSYYPGCVATFSSKELDVSTRRLTDMLDVELVDMPDATCCGAGDIQEIKPKLYLRLNARILAIAERDGQESILTICNVCTLNLRSANFALRENPELLDEVNFDLEKTGYHYSGNVEVTHLLWFLSGEVGSQLLRERVTGSLNGLKVAPFYGCQILRPSNIMGFDDPNKPTSIQRIITALGGQPVEYANMLNCCGFPILLAREEMALREASLPLINAKAAGADVIVTPCPLCHLALDAYQVKVNKMTGRKIDMPVLHFSQLVGLAAGMSVEEMQMGRHMIDPRPALAAAGHH